jgi:hypothetical protein
MEFSVYLFRAIDYLPPTFFFLLLFILAANTDILPANGTPPVCWGNRLSCVVVAAAAG